MDGQVPAGRAARRTFLAGLLTGAGVVAALGGPRPNAAASRTPNQKPASAGPAGPILYRRTPEAERYYRTLYH